MMNWKFSRILATAGPFGWLPIAPGTWGSAMAAAIWWFGTSFAALPIQISIIALLLPLAVWSAGVTEKELGHDAKPIVIDEVAGQWITLLMAPRIWYITLTGFVLFRIFDVLKPFPVDLSQRLPGGLGIVADDVLAGIYAGATLLILQKVFLA